ncbi:MAG: transporter substrate-binding domain-containing protein [Clostridia bacterium]|nr:transporter substrate-binding domain-containing protein [Clostridia bacterium]
MSQAKQASKKLSKRNLLIICIVVVLVAAAVIFAVVRNSNDENTLDKIKSKGKIVVAMEGTWMPWTYHDASGALTGFDVEVANALAAKLGVEVEFQECPWDSIFAGVDSGRYDLAINGVDWTQERADSLTLSDPYVYNYPVLIVKEGNEEIKTFADLNGKKTANTVSSTYAALAESYGATNQGVDDLIATFELVMQERVDATINSADTFASYKAENPDAPIVIVAQADTANSVVIVMKSGDESATLLAEINKAIAELKADGTLSQLSIKYFGTDMTALPSTENK